VTPPSQRFYPALAEVAALIGGIQIQGRASIGGNLCNAAPSADAVPILIALRATCYVAGPAGMREIAVEDFCISPGRNALGPGELLVSLHLPPPEPHSGARYLRFIPRNEMDIAVAGAGVSVTLDNGAFRSARIALSSVAPTPLYVREAGEWLAGKPANADSIHAAAEMAKAAAKPNHRYARHKPITGNISAPCSLGARSNQQSRRHANHAHQHSRPRHNQRRVSRVSLRAAAKPARVPARHPGPDRLEGRLQRR